jgi:hypothetical protein
MRLEIQLQIRLEILTIPKPLIAPRCRGTHLAARPAR